jgi:hypothetical protein
MGLDVLPAALMAAIAKLPLAGRALNVEEMNTVKGLMPSLESLEPKRMGHCRLLF